MAEVGGGSIEGREGRENSVEISPPIDADALPHCSSYESVLISLSTTQ